LENKAKHQAMFEEAMEGYRKDAENQLQEQLSLLESGKVPKFIRVMVNRPDNHSDEYDRAVQMLDHHEGKHLDLNTEEYATLVQNDWAWMRAWLVSNSGYSASAAAAIKEDDDA